MKRALKALILIFANIQIQANTGIMIVKVSIIIPIQIIITKTPNLPSIL